MSNNNTPPFRVVCIDDSDQLPNAPNVKKGAKYTVFEVLKNIHNDTWFKLVEIDGNYAFRHTLFAPLPPTYENVSKELAAAAINVGDTADVKIKQPQTN